MNGKHSKEQLEIKKLKKMIELKEQEILDIKLSVSDVLLQIRKINEANNYSDESIKRRRISELCTDTRYELLIDEMNTKIELDSSLKQSSSKQIKLYKFIFI